jgi:predicted PurR-regulated permease PerM
VSETDRAAPGVARPAAREETHMKNPFRPSTDTAHFEVKTIEADGYGPLPPVRINAFRMGLLGGLGVLAALLVGSIVTQLSTVLVYVGLALFLALGLDPLVSLIERKLPRPAAIAIVVLGALLAVAGILFAIVPILVKQTANLVEDIPGYVDDILASEWYHNLEDMFGDGFQDAVNGALSFVQDPANLLSIGGGIVAVGAGVATGLTAVTIVTILTLYFLGSLRSMKRALYRFVPAYRRQSFADVTDQVTGAVGRYVMGQVSLALVNGVLSFIFLTIIQAPLPALLALLAFIGSLIPLVGTLSASIIITALCFFNSPTTALVAGIYYLVYMQVEAYVLSPRIMNRAVSVPGSVVVIAAVAGGVLGGVLGALVAIPIAASIIIIIQKVVFPSQDAKKAPAPVVAS